MSAGKKGGKDAPDSYEEIWFSGQNNNPKEEEKMPDFQFYDDNRRTFLVIGSIVAVFVFVGILWFLYYQKNIAGPGEVPLIKADANPVKTRPSDPGGMEVPDQDKLIFDKVSGEETTLEEQVQPGPEQPVGDLAEKSIEDLIRETGPQDTKVADAAPPAALPSEPVSPGVYIIQLGAFGEEEGAERAWRIYQDRYKTVIGKLTPDIQRTTGSGGQVLFRLRAGYFADKAQAEEMCRRLKELGQECLAATR